MMPWRGPQVLSDRDNLGTGVVQVPQRLTDLGPSFTHAENQVGLGDQAGGSGRSQHVQGALVAETWPDTPKDSWDGLHVVRKDLRLCLENLAEIVGIAGEVGCQHLDACVGIELVNLTDRLGVQPGALIGKIITAHPGDRRIAKTHRLHRLGNPERLAGIESGRLPGVDLAEIAAPGADVAADQECGLAVLPTLEDVRTARFLADRVQALALHQLLKLAILRPHPRCGLDPRRLLLNRGARIANFQAEQPAAFGSDGHPVTLLCWIAPLVELALSNGSLRSLRADHRR